MKKIIYTLIFVFYCSIIFAQSPMIGEIRVFGFNFPPVDWAFCNGQLLPISDNAALFSLIGTTYGGDGQTTFALPNLQAKVAVGAGQGPGLSNYVMGQTGGSNTITYGVNNLPAHSHTFAPQSSRDVGNADNPSGNVPTTTSGNTYSTTTNATMGANSMSVNISNTGAGQPQNNIQPYLGINYCIALYGIYQGADSPYLGEIRMTAVTQIPTGWLPCDGRTLPITQNAALFSLLGTTYGGNGVSTFALPDLRGRVPICEGQAQGGSTYVIGEQGGVETETINIAMMAAHSHTSTATMLVFSGIGDSDTPVNNYVAINPQRGFEFSSTNNTPGPVGTFTTSSTGAGVPVSNLQPYVTVQYIICTAGIFPSRN